MDVEYITLSSDEEIETICHIKKESIDLKSLPVSSEKQSDKNILNKQKNNSTISNPKDKAVKTTEKTSNGLKTVDVSFSKATLQSLPNPRQHLSKDSSPNQKKRVQVTLSSVTIAKPEPSPQFSQAGTLKSRHQNEKPSGENKSSETKNCDAKPSESGTNKHNKHQEADRIFKLKKLESMLKKINKKIKRLEEAEVTSDEDEENAYIQLDRYRKRAVDIHKKICELNDKPADAERPTLRKISFCSSGRYPTISRALERRFNRTKLFPDFHEVKKLVTRASEKESLGLSAHEIPRIAQSLFIEFGRSLQRLRQWDDYTILTEYLNDSENDPADNPLNENLISKLSENKANYHNREKEVIDAFAQKQDEGKELQNEKNEQSIESSDSKSDSDSDEDKSEKVPDVSKKRRRDESSKGCKENVEKSITHSPSKKRKNDDSDNTSIDCLIIDEKTNDEACESEKENYMARLGLCEGSVPKTCPSPEPKLKIKNVISINQNDTDLKSKLELEASNDLKPLDTKQSVKKPKIIKYEELGSEKEIMTLDLEVVHASGGETESDCSEEENKQKSKLEMEAKVVNSDCRTHFGGALNKPKVKEEDPLIIFDKKETRIMKRFITSSVVCSEVITLD